MWDNVEVVSFVDSHVWDIRGKSSKKHLSITRTESAAQVCKAFQSRATNEILEYRR